MTSACRCVLEISTKRMLLGIKTSFGNSLSASCVKATHRVRSTRVTLPSLKKNREKESLYVHRGSFVILLSSFRSTERKLYCRHQVPFVDVIDIREVQRGDLSRYEDHREDARDVADGARLFPGSTRWVAQHYFISVLLRKCRSVSTLCTSMLYNSMHWGVSLMIPRRLIMHSY